MRTTHLVSWFADVQIGKPIVAQFFSSTVSTCNTEVCYIELTYVGDFHVEDQSKPLIWRDDITHGQHLAFRPPCS